eukprot:218925_1
MKKFIILMMLLAASLSSYAFVIKINGGGNEKSATLTQLGSKRLRCSWTEIPGATTYKIWLLSFRTNYEHVLASRTVHVVDTTKMGIIFKSKGNLAIRGNQYFCTVEAKSESFWFGEQWSSQISLITVNAKAPTAPPPPVTFLKTLLNHWILVAVGLIVIIVAFILCVTYMC